MTTINRRLIALVLLFTALAFGIFFIWQNGYHFSSFALLVLSLFVLYEITETVNSILTKTAQALSALANKDYAVKLSSQQLPSPIYTPLEEILNTQKEQHQDKNSLQIVYESIIESIDTGILILKETPENTIQIFFSNMAFSKHLELPKFTHWHLLEPHLGTFEDYLQLENWKDTKDIVTLSINGNEQVFSLRTFLSTIYKQRYLVVNLDTLQSIVDKKEKESWYNLMKIMSHEILNTITPISSLSDNLEYLIAERATELGDDFEDIQKSVSTIKKRTQYLSDFVNTYRQLAELPSPKKERVKIDSILARSLTTLSALIEASDIKVEQNIHPDARYFLVDIKQLEQVCINLLTNAIYALQKTEKPCIQINTYRTVDKV